MGDPRHKLSDETFLIEFESIGAERAGTVKQPAAQDPGFAKNEVRAGSHYSNRIWTLENVYPVRSAS